MESSSRRHNPKRAHGHGRWASAWTESLVQGNDSTINKALCATHKVEQILSLINIILGAFISSLIPNFTFFNKI